MWCFNLKKKIKLQVFCKLRSKNLKAYFPSTVAFYEEMCGFFFFLFKKRVRKVRETENPELPL